MKQRIWVALVLTLPYFALLYAALVYVGPNTFLSASASLEAQSLGVVLPAVGFVCACFPARAVVRKLESWFDSLSGGITLLTVVCALVAVIIGWLAHAQLVAPGRAQSVVVAMNASLRTQGDALAVLGDSMRKRGLREERRRLWDRVLIDVSGFDLPEGDRPDDEIWDPRKRLAAYRSHAAWGNVLTDRIGARLGLAFADLGNDEYSGFHDNIQSAETIARWFAPESLEVLVRELHGMGATTVAFTARNDASEALEHAQEVYATLLSRHADFGASEDKTIAWEANRTQLKIRAGKALEAQGPLRRLLEELEAKLAISDLDPAERERAESRAWTARGMLARCKIALGDYDGALTALGESRADYVVYASELALFCLWRLKHAQPVRDLADLIQPNASELETFALLGAVAGTNAEKLALFKVALGRDEPPAAIPADSKKALADLCTQRYWGLAFTAGDFDLLPEP